MGSVYIFKFKAEGSKFKVGFVVNYEANFEL